MPPVKLLSLTEEVNLNGGVLNTIEAGVGDSMAVTISKRTPDPSGVFFIGARGPGWTATHHTGTRDTALSLTTTAAGGDLTLRQAIPGGRFYLVPNPAATWVRRFNHGGGEGADVVSLAVDALTRTAAAAQTWYSGDGLKAGLGVRASSAGGRAYTLCARQKVRAGPNGVLHSVGGEYDSAAGPTLTAKLRPGKGVLARVIARPRDRVAGLSAVASPAWLGHTGGEGGGSRRGTLTLNATMPYGDGSGGKGGSAGPQAVAGLKWKF